MRCTGTRNIMPQFTTSYTTVYTGHGHEYILVYRNVQRRRGGGVWVGSDCCNVCIDCGALWRRRRGGVWAGSDCCRGFLCWDAWIDWEMKFDSWWKKRKVKSWQPPEIKPGLLAQATSVQTLSYDRWKTVSPHSPLCVAQVSQSHRYQSLLWFCFMPTETDVQASFCLCEMFFFSCFFGAFITMRLYLKWSMSYLLAFSSHTLSQSD